MYRATSKAIPATEGYSPKYAVDKIFLLPSNNENKGCSARYTRQTWRMEFFTTPDMSGALGGEAVKVLAFKGTGGYMLILSEQVGFDMSFKKCQTSRCVELRPRMPADRVHFAFVEQTAAKHQMTVKAELEQLTGSGRSGVLALKTRAP